MTAIQTSRRLDLRGRSITTFIVYEIRSALAEVPEGERIEVMVDVAHAIESDIRAWCRVTGHDLVDETVRGDRWEFTIQRGAGRPTGHRFAMVISDDGLLELLSPLGFALGAALEGHDVALYFNGPAVRVLGRDYHAKLHGLGRPFSRFPRTSLTNAGHLPPQDKLRQLVELGARIYACGPSMEHFKVPADDLAIPGVTIAEYLTFVEQLDAADVQMVF